MFGFRPKMFTEAEKTHGSPKLASQIFTFIIFFIISQLFTGIIASVFALPSMESSEFFKMGQNLSFKDSYAAAVSAMEKNPIVMIASLFATITGTLLSILYCRTFEHRSYGSMGFRKHKVLPHYLGGLTVGIIMMSLITAISVFTGVSEMKMSNNVSIKIIIVFFFGFIVQGMSEEVIFRGYLMNTIGGKHSAETAIIISSVGFAAAHLLNPGINVLAFINLVLFGVFAALYMICFDDIWGACAIHSIWNFTQGNIFGISVSGTVASNSIFQTTSVSNKDWLSGGDFGVEGSIITTLVLVTSSIIIFLLIKKKYAEKNQTDQKH